MIQIDEPPDQRACTGCMNPLVWLYSPRRTAWVSFVPGPDPLSLKVHQCAPGQDLPTWRIVREPDPPNELYRQAYEAIGHKNQDRIEEE